jgi:Ohr subfamily peroxiredoxin
VREIEMGFRHGHCWGYGECNLKGEGNVKSEKQVLRCAQNDGLGWKGKIMAIQVLYTGDATVVGARHGSAESSDGKLKVALSTPKSLGGDDGAGTNPEQLFAAAWGACFGGALEYIARLKGLDVTGVTIATKVGVGPNASGVFGLTAEMTVTVPSLDQAAAEDLVAAADKGCPYSNAVRGNVDSKITVVGGQ